MRITIAGSGKSWCGRVTNWAPGKSPMVAFGRRERGSNYSVQLDAKDGDILWGGNKPQDGTPYAKKYFQVKGGQCAWELGNEAEARALYKGPQDPSLYPRFGGGKRKRGGGNGYAPTPAPPWIPVPPDMGGQVPAPVPDLDRSALAATRELAAILAEVLRLVLAANGKPDDTLAERVSNVMSMAESAGLIQE